MTDAQMLRIVSAKKYEHPEQIRVRANALSVNAQLGRMFRMGMLERVPGARCYLYRSRHAGLV